VTVVECRKRVSVAGLHEGDQILIRKNKVLSSTVRHNPILRQC
jgi:hypothetical protein